MPLTDAAQQLVDEWEPEGHVPIATLGVQTARSQLRDQIGHHPADLELHAVDEPTPPAGARFSARRYLPTPTATGTLVYLHGGGWVLGDLDTEDRWCRQLASTADVAIVSIGYRLAPEHPFPAAMDDVEAALRWVARDHEALGVHGGLAVGGASAGGNLAAVVARRAAEGPGPTPDAQVLLCAALDPALDTPSAREHSEGALLTTEDMRFFWSAYLGAHGDVDDPDASPLRAPVLAGLAPALVVTAECDPLRDEAELYAARLAEAGVDVTSVRFGGMFHGFFGFPERLEAASATLATVAAFLRARIGQGG